MVSDPTRPAPSPLTPGENAARRHTTGPGAWIRRPVPAGHVAGAHGTLEPRSRRARCSQAAGATLACMLVTLLPGLAWAAPDLSPGPVGSPRWLAAAGGLALGAFLAARQIRRRMR